MEDSATETVDRSGAPLVVGLQGRWISHDRFEALAGGTNVRAHVLEGGAVEFEFHQECGLMAGAGLRLLSLLNQLVALGAGSLHLRFASQNELFGYLNRNGFFDFLDPRITSDPPRPASSSATLLRGQASSLVEIARLDPTVRGEARDDTVTPLVDALVRFYPKGARTTHLHNSAYAALTELIDNVYSHSASPIPGFALLQAYPKRQTVHIAVSDSGIGIPESLRRGLGARVVGRSDAELIVDAFRRGLSRHGSQQGHNCGLPRCAQLAAEFGSRVQVRTPTADVTLEPHEGGPGQHHAHVVELGPVLLGTHVCLEFPLDGQ